MFKISYYPVVELDKDDAHVYRSGRVVRVNCDGQWYPAWITQGFVCCELPSGWLGFAAPRKITDNHTDFTL